MMTLTLVLSALLLTVCGAAVALVLYAFQGSSRVLLRHPFLWMGGSLVLWAFGLAVTMAAPNEQIAAIGRRVMPVGWGLMTCTSVHFFLRLTGRAALLRHWWIRVLIYLPGAVIILGYTILPLFGLNPDTLVQTDLGWMTISPIDGWDWFFFIHSPVFAAVCIGLQFTWKGHATDAVIRKQGRILAVSSVLAAVCGIGTDILPLLLGIPIPQMSAIFMLGPIIAVTWCVKRYAMLRPEVGDPGEIILSKAARVRVYRHMSVAAFAISIGLIVCKNLFFPDRSWLSVALYSAFWMLSGLAHTLINRMDTEDDTKEMLEATHFALLIPAACLWFNALGMLAMWAIVFPMLIFSLLNNRRIMLAALIASSFLTQLFNWAYMPEASLQVFGPVYLARMLLLLFAAAIAVYVHHIYTSRLRENVDHLDMQGIISAVSHEFITVGAQNFDEKILSALEVCGKFIRSDRAYLALFEEDGDVIRYVREWLAPGVPSQLEDFELFFRDMNPMVMRQLRDDNIVLMRDARRLPRKAGKIRKMLAEQNIRALVNLPIRKEKRVIGLMGFNSGRPFRQWNLSSAPFLQIVAGIVTDAVIKTDGEREINFIAYHDQLTRLPNRILFNDRLHQAIELARRTGKMLGVVFMDLDSFKTINDTMGHDQGDQLLVQMAHTLTVALRRYDTVARFGGDEFILLVNQIGSMEDLHSVMEHITAAVKKPVVLSGQEFFVTMSAGVAVYPQDGLDGETLIKNADTAMYSAKNLGKNRYVLCSADMKEEILERLKLTNLLYHALERQELLLYYQPQVDVETHAIVGLEALIRWRLPDRGLVAPLQFIPLAEQTGLIQPIGEWVLMTACRQLKAWQDRGLPTLRMAVNVSVHQLKNPRFVKIVANVLERTGLPPQYLELEITESVASGSAESMVAMLGSLKALGVSISIDDFGTEYSSLSRLKLLPVDRIKLDMQFVQGIEHSEKDQAISRVVINLAKSLNLKVIAEGVETAPQMEFLSHKMCDEVQGYFCYRPMPAQQVEAILFPAQDAAEEPAAQG